MPGAAGFSGCRRFELRPPPAFVIQAGDGNGSRGEAEGSTAKPELKKDHRRDQSRYKPRIEHGSECGRRERQISHPEEKRGFFDRIDEILKTGQEGQEEFHAEARRGKAATETKPGNLNRGICEKREKWEDEEISRGERGEGKKNYWNGRSRHASIGFTERTSFRGKTDGSVIDV